MIERPANLLKELIENTLDAKASRIEITIQGNGLETIIISDNGIGIPFEELGKAFERHTTSKILHYEDLFNLLSYGFRGEALASMASIARIECTSRPKQQGLIGGKIVIEGGKQLSLVPTDRGQDGTIPHGTTIVVKDLFYNTPARLKFMKSKHSEKGAIKRVLWAFLLTWPQTEFIITWDNKNRQIYPPEEGSEKRCRELFGLKKGEELFLVEASHKGISCQIFMNITSPSRTQYLFVNNRLVQDKNLHQRLTYTVENIFKGAPLNYLLFISMPPENLDVNVHPHKSVVKFEDPGLVYELIVSSCQKRLHREAPLSSPSGQQNDNENENENKNEDEDEECSTSFSSSQLTSLSSSYCINLRSLLSNYFLVWASSSLNEEEMIPLLIGEIYKSFPAFLERYRQDLRSLGLEFDYLGHEQLILRTIPEEWRDWPYQEFLQSFINYCQNYLKTENYKLKDLLTHFLAQHNLWSPPQLSTAVVKRLLKKGDWIGRADPNLFFAPGEWMLLDQLID